MTRLAAAYYPNPWAQVAITVIALLVILALLAVVLVDVSLEVRGRRPIGRRIQRWSRRYVVVSTLLVLVVGALLGHFFWQAATR
jgi:hypothetical protein